MSVLYLALLIPLIMTGIFYYFKPREFTWWEFFIPIGSVLVAIAISHLIIEKSSVNFKEYWGSSIVQVFEQQPYNYWQHQTCSYTTCTGSGKNEVCTTHYYDCSHQVDVGPEWWAVTNLQEKFAITEKLHDELVKQFGTGMSVFDSHSNYAANDGCAGSRGTKFEGKRVGNTSYVYQTLWNGTDDTRKAYTSVHSYVNKIKASDLSIFNMKIVKDKQADSLGLFKYPKYENGGMFGLTQGTEYPTILGSTVSKETQEKFRRLNGKYGVSNQLRLWVLVFENKPMSIVEYQKNYWVGGNMNELVICIGKKGNEIQWSRAFSWSLSDELTSAVQNQVLSLYTYRDSTVKKNLPRVIPITKEIRHAVNKLKLDKNKLPVVPMPKQVTVDTIIKVQSSTAMLTEKTWDDYYNFLNENLNRYKRRTFKEFDYLSVEPSTLAIIIVYIIALIISIAMNIWVTTNDIYDMNNDDNKKRKNNYY